MRMHNSTTVFHLWKIDLTPRARAVIKILPFAILSFMVFPMKFSGPNLLLRSEGLAVLIAACVAYRELGESWGKFAALFLAPDLLMLGYLLGKKVGAGIYNTGHTYTAPFLLWVLVYSLHRPGLFAFCLIWTAHIGFDRLLGYGLKYSSGFKDTHLNRV